MNGCSLEVGSRELELTEQNLLIFRDDSGPHNNVSCYNPLVADRLSSQAAAKETAVELAQDLLAGAVCLECQSKSTSAYDALVAEIVKEWRRGEFG